MYETEKTAAQGDARYVENLWCAICRALASYGTWDVEQYAEVARYM